MKLRTSLYHPQRNSQGERFNSILINMLGMLAQRCKFNWKGSIGELVPLTTVHKIQLLLPHVWETTQMSH